jgi:hypothetical protein
MPILAFVDVPPPPGWAQIPPDARAEYVQLLAGAGVRVNWPTE